jgi:hypothetical protein
MRSCLAAAATIAAASPAKASDHDPQAWLSLTATVAVAKRVDATMEVHTRFTDDASRLGQLLLRPSVTLKLDDRFSLAGGYVYVRNDLRGTLTSEEHRLWQQLGYVLHQRNGVRLSGRTRIEQRQRAGAPADLGWRLRQQLRLQLPLPRSKVAALVWNETFMQLNDTRWGARGGIDQVRSFAGLSVPITSRFSVEPGYLNQAVFRVGADRINHIAVAAFVARL